MRDPHGSGSEWKGDWSKESSQIKDAKKNSIELPIWYETAILHRKNCFFLMKGINTVNFISIEMKDGIHAI